MAIDVGPAVVVGGEAGMGRAVAERLRAAGAPVTVIGAEVDLTDRDAVATRFASVDGPIALVVVAPLDPSSFVERPMTDLDESAWDAAAELPLRTAIVALQAAYAAVPDGARVVIVLPTVAAVGVPGLVASCTAVEGIRVLAKATARRWGTRKITVNVIEVELSAYVSGDADPGGAPPLPSLPVIGTPALAPGSAVDDVVGLIGVLCSDAAAGLTGALLVADRGTVMQP